MASWDDVLRATKNAITNYEAGNYTRLDLEQMRIAANHKHRYSGGYNDPGEAILRRARDIAISDASMEVHEKIQMSGDTSWCEECRGYYLPHSH
jgi:hypothetical protein